ncbi:MAG: hypothetical protein IBX43_00715 [Campylobacterales bacterium]|nr:hypothetical protein [Campylobacterales bacterium]
MAKERLDLLAGVEYWVIKDTLLFFEVANRHIFVYESQATAQTDFVSKKTSCKARCGFRAPL